jgi:AraC-like DNA-binding protein/quercetin dioxygenase-like cupin family protein
MEFGLRKIEKEIELLGFNCIYYFELGKDFSHPPERHDFWEMVYVDSGQINVVADGIGRAVRQGEVIFHRPGELHAHVSGRAEPNDLLIVSFSSDSEAMRHFEKKIFSLDKTGRTLMNLFKKEAHEALGEALGEVDNRNVLWDLPVPDGALQLLECYLTEFLLILLRSDEGGISAVRTENSRALAQSSIAELVVSYLEENVYRDLSLADVCNRFYMGKSQLSKLFAEYTDDSPMGYFAKLKIAEAKRLLRQDGLSVSRISDMLGYSSIHNFSRAFKRMVGVSPLEYRGR